MIFKRGGFMKNYKHVFDAVFKEINKVIVGQNDVIEQIFSFYSMQQSNALLEGYPGLAKNPCCKDIS